METTLPFVLFASLLLLAGCDPVAPSPVANDPMAQWPSVDGPRHELKGRTLVVQLPDHTMEGMVWVAGTDDLAATPFVFKSLDFEPGARAGAGVTTFVYEADGPGRAKLTFGLVPAGKTLIGPLHTRVDAAHASIYSVDVEVPL